MGRRSEKSPREVENGGAGVEDVDLSMVTRAVALFCASLTASGSCEREEDVLARAQKYEDYIHTGTI